MKRICIACAVLISVLPVSVLAEMPSALEIIHKYTAYLNSMNDMKLLVKYDKEKQSYGRYAPKYSYLSNKYLTSYRSGMVAYDGTRWRVHEVMWGDVGGKARPGQEQKKSERRFLWDNKTMYQYFPNFYSSGYPSSGYVHITRSRSHQENTEGIYWLYPGNIHLGYLDPGKFPVERLDKFLLRPKSISVRKNMERIGDSNCIVVDTELDIGSFTIWFDPKHGYAISKLISRQRTGHIGNKGLRITRGDKHKVEWIVGDYKKINDIWLPHRIEVKYDCYYSPNSVHLVTSGENAFKMQISTKLKDFNLNPDFEKLRSFELWEMSKGARVYLMGEGTKGRWGGYKKNKNGTATPIITNIERE